MERTPLLSQIRRLAGHSAVYGSADVVSQVLSLLLTPLFVAILGPAGTGILGLLLLFSGLAKIVFRMGLEAGFFRIHYDLKTDAERRELAGTVALFSAVAGAVLWGLIAIGSPWVASLLFRAHDPAFDRFVLLAATDVYLGTFLFIPLVLLRIRNRPGLFAAFVAGRNIVNTALKVGFLLAGWGVAGVLWSDIAATALLALALSPMLARETRLAFNPQRLRAVLAFGLPKAPHGIMVQIVGMSDRWFLQSYHGLAVTGFYDKAYALGSGVKFVLSAFEPAWQPFVFAQIGRSNAQRTFARLVTYVWAVFLAVGLSVAVLGRELLMTFTFTDPSFWVAAPVVPVVALGCLCHGAFLLTSIGIGIEKKTRYYPVVTLVSAAVNVGGNFLLVPRWGMLGAAWVTVASYAAMAIVGYTLSHRVYPIPLEASRLLRLSLAAGLTFFLCGALAPAPTLGTLTAAHRTVALFVTEVAPHLLPAVAAKLLLLATFPALVALFGVVRREEWEWLTRWLGARARGGARSGMD